ncbi:MAG: putative Serine/Threonine kinase domain protein, partial [Streblomastix strix]
MKREKSEPTDSLLPQSECEEILRQLQLVPIRPLGQGAFGLVYLVYNRYYGIIVVKIVQKEKFNNANSCAILFPEYSNMKTLDLIAKHPQIPLPSFTLRALMKQILEGLRVFHSAGLVHRDVKCENILLHSPPDSGRVYAKISDFGFAKKEDSTNEQSQIAGTLPFMAPEIFKKPLNVTQKVDIYALGITFYKLITHKYLLHYKTYEEFKQHFNSPQFDIDPIEKAPEIKDNLLWDLLSQMLEFDPVKRLSAAQALQHPYFMSPEVLADISKEQKELAKLSEE